MNNQDRRIRRLMWLIFFNRLSSHDVKEVYEAKAIAAAINRLQAARLCN